MSSGHHRWPPTVELPAPAWLHQPPRLALGQEDPATPLGQGPLLVEGPALVSIPAPGCGPVLAEGLASEAEPLEGQAHASVPRWSAVRAAPAAASTGAPAAFPDGLSTAAATLADAAVPGGAAGAAPGGSMELPVPSVLWCDLGGGGDRGAAGAGSLGAGCCVWP
eukprot:scaffold197789_cov24-Tisochrysis_lutea.AAC.1